MQIIKRAYTGSSDLQRIADLVLSFPSDNPHVVDQPYRLSAWNPDLVENIGLWENANGQLVGYAIIQESFAILDYSIHPKVQALNLRSIILQWAVTRSQVITDERSDPFSLYVLVPENRIDHVDLLMVHGFKQEDWTELYFTRPLSEPIITPGLPEGFTLRRLRGNTEVADYVALHRTTFGTKRMTVGWRRRILRMWQYDPELDIIIIAPNGRLAAFCVCWMHPDGSAGQVEPVGVHPDFRRMGLGRIVLLENLRRIQVRGAETAIVVTDSFRYPAQKLYEAVGFRREYTVLSYGRKFVPT